MRNWKTTLLGILTIIVAVASAAKSFLATGSVPDIATLTTAVLAGWGLVMAKDNNARL
jgi:hypothetical protein